MNYKRHFEQLISALKSEGRYRSFMKLKRHAAAPSRATVESQENVTVWCSNDYLGMSRHPAVLQAMHNVLDDVGAGAGGTRNIAGNSVHIVALEQSIADLHRKHAALVFSSGYVANQTTLATLAQLMLETIIFSDAHNHALIIQGLRLARCAKQIFRHNDLGHLEQLLKDAPAKTPKIIVFESVYSMDGDTSPMSGIISLAKKYNALTYLDEVHAVGLYGRRGGGLSEEWALAGQIDVINGTLGKAYGCVGGYIAGDTALIDVVRSYGSGFIFTTALPPHIAAGATASIEHLKISTSERTLHRLRVGQTKTALAKAGFDVLTNKTHIVPLMIGDPVVCKSQADLLLGAHGIYVQPINYPTVESGTERFRLTPSPHHSAQDIARLVEALRDVLGIPAAVKVA